MGIKIFCLPRRRAKAITLLRPIFLASGFALVFLFIGGAIALDNPGNRFIGLIIVWLISGVAGGAFLGLLFGIPRRNKIDAGLADELSKNPATKRAARASFAYGGNTNFEEISDWLTKVIVGATLVGLRDACAAIWSAARNVDAFSGQASSAGGTLVVGAGGTGIIAGFVSMYLWTRSQLPRLLNKAEAPDDPDEVASAPRRDGEYRELSAQNTAGKRDTVPLAADFRPTGEAPWAGKLEGLSSAAIWDADFNLGRFGGVNRTRTRVLSATLGKETKSGVEVTLIVKSVDPSLAPLVGPVTFYLHPTFTAPVIEVEAVSSVAKLLILTVDAFTIGVECDGGSTVLELNLANEPGFPMALGGRIPGTSEKLKPDPIREDYEASVDDDAPPGRPLPPREAQ